MKADGKREESSGGGPALADDDLALDVTQLPKLLDKRFLELDEDAALRCVRVCVCLARHTPQAPAPRPTIINPLETWTRRRCKSLLSEPELSHLGADEQVRARAGGGAERVSRTAASLGARAQHGL